MAFALVAQPGAEIPYEVLIAVKTVWMAWIVSSSWSATWYKTAGVFTVIAHIE